MPLQTTITNVSGKTLNLSWLPPHGKKLPAGSSITIGGDVVNYHLFPEPDYKQISAIFRASTGASKIVTVVTENV